MNTIGRKCARIEVLQNGVTMDGSEQVNERQVKIRSLERHKGVAPTVLPDLNLTSTVTSVREVERG